MEKKGILLKHSPEQSLFQRPENGQPSFRVSKGRGYSPSQDNTHLGLDFSLLSETLSKKINCFSPMGKRPPVAAAQGRDPTVERAEVAREGAHRWRSQRQMEASSHTAIRMLLSRLKLVWRMAEVQRGRVRVMHLERDVPHGERCRLKGGMVCIYHGRL